MWAYSIVFYTILFLNFDATKIDWDEKIIVKEDIEVKNNDKNQDTNLDKNIEL